MRKLFWLPVAAICAVNLQAASIQFQVSNLGGSSYRYNYTLNGFTLGANQEIDLQFDPNLYSNLTNGVSGPGFQMSIFEPNSPGGVPGDYLLFTPTANPSLVGPFSVDFKYLGMGAPATQPFFITSFDNSGVNVIGSPVPGGNTSLAPSGVPEPGTWPVLLLAALTGFIWHARKRRSIVRA